MIHLRRGLKYHRTKNNTGLGKISQAKTLGKSVESLFLQNINLDLPTEAHSGGKK